jgi:hypothetical protein
MMGNRFNWDQWTNFDDYRVDDEADCNVVSPDTTATSSATTTASTASSATSGVPEPELKCPPRIESFILVNSSDTIMYMESGYLC